MTNLQAQRENVYYFDLNEGEQILFLLRQHPITNAIWILTFVFMMFFPFLILYLLGQVRDFTFMVVFGHLLVAVWYLITLGYAFEQFIVWYFNVYLVTNKRVIDIDVHGFLHKHIAETPLSNVQDVTFEAKGIMATLFNMGTVHIQTAGATKEFELQYVSDPARVHDVITDQLKLYTHHV